MKKNYALAITVCALALQCSAEDKSRTVTVKNDTSTSVSKRSPRLFVLEHYVSMGETSGGVEKRQEVENAHRLAAQEVQNQIKDFEKARSEYASKESTMSADARKKELKRLQKLEDDIKTLASEKEEEVKQIAQNATESLLKDLSSAVEKVAREVDADVVLSKNTGEVLWASEEFNLTEKVTREMNKQYEIKLAQNKQSETTATKIADNKSSKTSKVNA